mgnify:CR=1 FL=1
MDKTGTLQRVGALSLVLLFAGCAPWDQMSRQEKGTTVGATGGAVVGAAVGGPVGAAVGAVGGGVVGHETTTSGPMRIAPPAARPTVREAQAALNRLGYDPGPIDGQFGPGTVNAVKLFQQDRDLPPTGTLADRTLAALGVARR